MFSDAPPRINHFIVKVKVKQTTYISTMLQQDLHNLDVVPCNCQVQGCPPMVNRIHINSFGQQ